MYYGSICCSGPPFLIVMQPIGATCSGRGTAPLACQATSARVAARLVSCPKSRKNSSVSRGGLRSQEETGTVVCVAEAEQAVNQAELEAFGQTLRYKRVMLKVSGEALEGEQGFGIDPVVLQTIAKQVAAAASEGLEIAIVVGGGNFFRGGDRWPGLERATADYVGMLATVMNAICLQSALEAEGVQTRVQTGIAMAEVAEPYIRRRAIRHLERGRVVIFGAGTGNPFFTTDTAAALRAAEIGADAFFKATKVDGVYDCDPATNPGAVLQRRLSFREVMLRSLNVMDETAITLCKENSIPVVVFNLTTPGNVLRALLGDPEVGTSISSDCSDSGGSESSQDEERSGEQQQRRRMTQQK